MSANSEIRLHSKNGISVGEVVADGLVVKTPGHLMELAFTARAQKADRLALRVEQLDPAFFELRSGLAGEMLQKFVNYGQKLVVVGDVGAFTAKSESFAALVRESNRGRDVRFVKTMDEALSPWS